jgi:hypothetical protein
MTETFSDRWNITWHCGKDHGGRRLDSAFSVIGIILAAVVVTVLLVKFGRNFLPK